MVRAQIAARGIRDARVLEAMRAVPREEFVPEPLREHAYDDEPLPIGDGQTISQPYIVAAMLEALGLTGRERVLEVGAGSGYAAALLGRLAREVWALELVPSLARGAAAALERAGAHNVHVSCADGTMGLPGHAPYDAILVSAAGPEIPPALVEQLAVGGRLVIPVGIEDQRLFHVTRRDSGIVTEPGERVRFVPLVAG